MLRCWSLDRALAVENVLRLVVFLVIPVAVVEVVIGEILIAF
jgi:hypothetical protein